MTVHQKISLPELTKPDATGLDCCTLDLAFRARDHIAPHASMASLWRSVLGPALADVDASWHRAFFRPQLPATVPARYSAPAPFVVHAVHPGDLMIQPGDVLPLTITLFGKAVLAAEAVVQALILAAERGLGRERGQLDLAGPPQMSTFGLDDIDLPPCPDWARIVFVSPQQLRDPVEAAARRKKGQRRTMTVLPPDRFEAGIWLAAVQRRLDLMSAVYGTGPGDFSEAPPPKVFFETEELWSINASRRHRERRDVDVAVSGMLGSFRLNLIGAACYWPAVWHSQWLHSGNKTSMGNGAVRVVPLTCRTC